MSFPLKYNTASQEVPLGFFLDSTNGDTEETGLTIANTDIWLWKSGATTLANKNAGGATHIQNGIYYCVLDDTDTDTYGPLVIFVHESGALTVRLECVVMNADAYDALYAANGTGHIEADAVQVSGDAAAANNLELDYDGTGYDKSASTIGTVTANTDMRGTDNAALASVVGALADAAADGDPTNADTVVQYVKQLINILVGTAGVTTFPAEAAPGDGVSLAEVIRAMHVDVTGLNGDVMRGTDGANTVVPDIAGTAATLHTATDADIATAQADLDIITGATGVNLLAATQASIDAIEADTNELQTDDVPGLIATAQADLDIITGATGVNLLAATQASIDAIEAGVALNTLVISPIGGITDGNGAVDGSTVLDSTRAEATGHWNSLSIEITSGAYLGQTRTIEVYTNGVGFMLSKGFSGQILAGVTYRVISAIVYQPNIDVTKNYAAIVEVDTSSIMGMTVITNSGQPTIGDLTAGVITINRIRAGASVAIVAGVACTVAAGNIYYVYAFPSASWQPGDLYQAIFTGQAVAVNGISYDLSAVFAEGRVSREAVIEADTAEIGVAGAGLTAVPWNAAWDAEVESEVQDAIEVNRLDHLVAVADADDPVDDSIVAKLAASDGDWSGFDDATDSLEAIRDRGDAAWITGGGGAAPTAAEVADAVWDEASADHLAAGSTGEALDAASTPGAAVAADIWAYATRTLTSASTAPGVGLDEQIWTVMRGDTLDRTFSDIAADGSITKCQLTVKRHPGPEPDTEAILAVDSTTGLIRLNGAAAGAYTATFTLPGGVLAVPAATMAQLGAPKRWHYDVQVWRGAEVETIEIGRLVDIADVTRLVT